MKLIVAEDLENRLVALWSLRTEWRFGELIELTRKALAEAIDMYEAVGGAKVPRTSPEGSAFAAGPIPQGVFPEGIPYPVNPPPVSEQLVLPVLPTVDRRPTMELDTDKKDFEMRDSVIALQEHTRKSREAEFANTKDVSKKGKQA